MITPSSETDAAPPERGCKGLIFLAGAIKYWWLTHCKYCDSYEERVGRQSFCNTCGHHGGMDLWGSPEHTEYIQWRDYIRRALIQEGYLTYAPHEAFKGTWTDSAQAVNNAAIAASDVMLVLSPPGIPTEGTDDEVQYAARVNTPVINLPSLSQRACECSSNGKSCHSCFGSGITIPDLKNLLTSIEREIQNGNT